MVSRSLRVVPLSMAPKAELGKPIVLGQLDGSSDSAAILWLHGFGDSPGGWAEALQPFRTSLDAKVQWIHLCAPTFSQPCFGNRKFRAWGQFLTQDRIRPGSTDYTDNDKDGAGPYASSVEAVLAELSKLEQSVSPKRLLIGGFSQGAAIALECALRYQPLAGCIILAGWARPAVQHLLATKPEISTPFLVCHGESDDMVDVACAEAVKDLLKKSGAEVHFHKYPGIQHESCPELLNDVMEFICKRLHLPIPENVTWENGSDSDAETAAVYVSRTRLNALQNAPAGEEISTASILGLIDPTGLAESETLVPAVFQQPGQLLSMPSADAIKAISDAVRDSAGPEITVKEWHAMHAESSEECEGEEEELSGDATDSDEEEAEGAPLHGEDTTVTPPEKKLRRDAT